MKFRWMFSRQRLGGVMALSAMLLAALAAACGGSDPTATPSGANPTSTPTTTTGTAGPTATAAASPVSQLGRGGTLRIAITAADVPMTEQIADQGAEGQRWVSNLMGEGLIGWDLGQDDYPPDFVPALAESWEIDPEDDSRWIFHIRQGMTFHDGTPITAQDIAYNFERALVDTAPHYNATIGSGRGSTKIAVASFNVVDDMTFEVFSHGANSFLLYELVAIKVHSPTAMAAAGPDNYRNNPKGSGVFKYVSQQARTALTMEPYENYFGDKARLNRVIILPMPEATTRLAALRNNEVDWIEVPPPDAIPGLQRDGYQIYMTQTSHNWPHQFNLTQAPFDNKLVRQAMNYAIDRDALCRDLLNNTCEPGLSFANQATPWVGESESFYSYDPAKARALLAEAGVTTPLTYKVLISASGSGQMLPVPMNEFVQRNLAAVGINMEIQVIEWNTYIQQLRNGFVNDNADLDGANISWLSVDPANFIRQFHSASAPPGGWNITGYSNPELDQLLDGARSTTDLALRDQYLTQANQIITEDAPWLFIAHDRNPRVLNARVKNYVQEKHTYTSITNVWVE